MTAPSSLPSLLDVDRDGAVAETLDALPASTRAEFLRGGAGLALAGAAPLLAPGAPASAATLPRIDLAILRFDLVLEYLQANMYTEAERIGAISRSTLRWSRVIGAHEWAHVRAIKGILGPRAVRPPRFDYHGVTEDDDAFTRTAVAFEDLTAALLKSQSLRVQSKGVLAALLSLHTVEARHAAWVRHQLGYQPVFTAFDQPQPQRRMSALIRRTRFIAGPPPRTGTAGRPPFTG